MDVKLFVGYVLDVKLLILYIHLRLISVDLLSQKKKKKEVNFSGSDVLSFANDSHGRRLNSA